MDFLVSLAIVIDELSALDIFLASAIVLLLYVFFLSRQSISILDPILYYSVSSYFATTMATLYWIANLISDEDFYWICICTFLYYLGFILTSSFPKGERVLLKDIPANDYLFLIIIIFVINQLVIYKFYGIPLFMTSRLTQFTDAGGWGIISRFGSVLMPYLLFCSFLVYQNKKTNLSLILLTIVFVIFLSGSKAAILNIFWFYFIANKVMGNEKIKIKAIYFILTFILSLIVIAIQNDFGDLQSALNQFWIRLLAFGDVFSYAYINNSLKIIAHKDYMALIYPLLQPIRVVSPDSLPIPGFELYKYVYNWSEASTGPNPRLPVYIDYFYDRYFFLIPMILGMILGYIRRCLFCKVQSWSSKCFLSLLYISFCSAETDPINTFVSIFNIVLCFFILSIPYIIIRCAKR